MPLVYQQNINAVTKIGVWHIAETEDHFLKMVPLQREITHWHKRLQHLAGRFLLLELYPEFPVDLIRIADTKKPFLEKEAYHFSISHCGDYAAVMVSKEYRVGVDVERISSKIEKIKHKFLHERELELINSKTFYGINREMSQLDYLTLCWSVKESVFKWWGRGEVDFIQHIFISAISGEKGQGIVHCMFKGSIELHVHYLNFNNNFLTWVITTH